ncbi:MAG: Gfo/Idh/MocA family oxidoreductase [Clostridia bacterium]|nr:Gfo/Idh/MocA family oxidoreductase [Clostridia bacterium]
MKKIRIAFLGTENSHAFAFCRVLCGNPDYADIEIVGAYGPDEEANKQLRDAGYVSYFAKTPDEFLGKVDAVVVTARHGDLHYEYAMPYLKAGIHAFIDKPFTVDLSKAQEMFDVANKTGALMCGGSTLRFLDEFRPLARFVQKNKVVCGHVAAPIDMVNEYGGFYFYAQHLTESVLTIFGPNVRSVLARAAAPEQNRVSVIFSYDDFDVAGTYTSSYTYAARVMGEKECLDVHTVGSVSYAYTYEINEMVEMFRTGKRATDDETMIRPLRILHAIEESYTAGKEVTL